MLFCVHKHREFIKIAEYGDAKWFTFLYSYTPGKINSQLTPRKLVFICENPLAGRDENFCILVCAVSVDYY